MDEELINAHREATRAVTAARKATITNMRPALQRVADTQSVLHDQMLRRLHQLTQRVEALEGDDKG